MNRTLALETKDKIESEVHLMGWVNSRRDHGGLIFIDLRDESGIVQLTIDPQTAGSDFALAEGIRDEYVIVAEGKVINRQECLVNPNISTGSVEVVASSVKILNKSEALPIQINSDQEVGEDVRLKYRFLDLRREKMQTRLKQRAQMFSKIRSYMEGADFTEVTTPILASSSPEGARDFLVPSRLQPGKFYALPQAPQQFKQLLMVGGVPRYYQMATCFRDEDPRADRLYGEFYQLDLEMSFVTDGEQVRQMIEPLIKSLSTDFAGKKLAFGDEVPRMTYQEAMDKYGSDKPDLRYGMQLVDLSSDLKDCEFGVFSGSIKDGGVVKAIAAPGAASFSRSQIDKLTDLVKSSGAGGLPYITITNAGEIKSPIAKFFSDAEIQAIQDRTDAKPGNIIFFGSDQRQTVNSALGDLRKELGSILDLASDDEIALAWVTDFPFYEPGEKPGSIDTGHNPFSMPKGGLEGLDAEDKLSIIADQYDMVMNGYEICSGSIRNHSPEIMYKVFANLGYDQEYVDDHFGGMINAFKYGAPPHGGCAFGIDRMFMVLVGEDNIREVVAFPKNGSGVDLMMNSPNTADPNLLKDLGI